MPTAWVAMALTTVGFVYLRYGVATPDAIAFAQVLYLIPPMLAAVSLFSVAYIAPRRSRIQVAWLLLAISMTFLFFSEALTAWQQVSSDGAEAVVLLFDVVNGLALLGFLATLTVASSVSRLGGARALRLVLDTVALLTLGFVLILRFWVHRMVTVAGSADIFEAVRLTGYCLIGFMVIAGVVGVVRLAGLRRMSPWDLEIAVALGLYGLALVLWPLWSLSANGLRSAPAMEALVSTLFLLGYSLVFIGALTRTLAPERAWRLGPWAVSDSARVWPSIAMSSLVLVSVVVLGWAVFDAATGSTAQLVYLVALSVATVCLVGRTALASAETSELKDRAATDAVTGAYNVRRLEETLGELCGNAHRAGEGFAVAVIDIDEFSRVNEVLGLSGADAVLRRCASALELAAGSRDRLFRIAGDEFAVIVRSTDRTVIESRLRLAIASLAGIEVDGRPLSASIGYAVCPLDADSPLELLRKADGAESWAKYHGKSRIVAYDERTAHALGVEERLSLLEEQAKMDMARALAAAADARDPANYYHSRNVAALCVLVGEALGLDPNHVRRIEIAAMLHDVGKIALPDEMLGLRTLTARQQHAAREHSELGERLVDALGEPGVAQWVRAHHERWDGHGYPDGLVGEDIPLESRIIALADAYDAMTTGKRYGAPMSKGAALQEIDLGMGARFDPELSEKFIAIVASVGALGWTDGWTAA